MYEVLLVSHGPQSGLEIYRAEPCRNGNHPILSKLTEMADIETIGIITAISSPDG